MYRSKTSYKFGDKIPNEFNKIKSREFGDWEIPPWDLIIDDSKIIGKGNFGTVYLGSWRKTTVVVKISNTNISKEDEQLFLSEFEVMTKMHHPNIIQLLGYVREPFMIVMEYLPKNDLTVYISEYKLKIKKKINICIEILKGVCYLHNRKPQYIIHRDLKPQNIIFSKSGIPKISDFGLSKNLNNIILKNEEELDLDLTSHVGSKRYMSPEIKDSSIYDYKTDIWSLGIIFYELFENIRFNNKLIWIKTPIKIRKIIENHMIQKVASNRSDAINLISLFENEINKKSFCFRCFN